MTPHHEEAAIANGKELSSEMRREIALEEEKLKVDSEKDVQRQLQQQHVAETEEKIGESIDGAADKLLSPRGLAVEAKLAPALSLVENVAERVVSDVSADIEAVREEVQKVRHQLHLNQMKRHDASESESKGQARDKGGEL